MRRWMIGLALASLGLGGCVSYHQERAALRMPRPRDEPAELSAYAPPKADYPTVGGDILRGTAPTLGAAFDATENGAPR